VNYRHRIESSGVKYTVSLSKRRYRRKAVCVAFVKIRLYHHLGGNAAGA
jgi:hypothetical protein